MSHIHHNRNDSPCQRGFPGMWRDSATHGRNRETLTEQNDIVNIDNRYQSMSVQALNDKRWSMACGTTFPVTNRRVTNIV